MSTSRCCKVSTSRCWRGVAVKCQRPGAGGARRQRDGDRTIASTRAWHGASQAQRRQSNGDRDRRDGYRSAGGENCVLGALDDGVGIAQRAAGAALYRYTSQSDLDHLPSNRQRGLRARSRLQVIAARRKRGDLGWGVARVLGAGDPQNVRGAGGDQPTDACVCEQPFFHLNVLSGAVFGRWEVGLRRPPPRTPAASAEPGFECWWG